MAFNPFHGFRKHQKVVFAALTIICMLTFVMASGSFAGGDFFSELTRWVTGGRSRIREAAIIYGKRISDRDLRELRQQRRLANDFMLRAVLHARENIFANVRNNLSQLDQNIQNQLQDILFRAQIAAFNPSDYLKNLQVYLLQLQLIDRQLADAKKPTEQLNALRQLQAALQRDYWLFHTPKDELYPDENLYFGGSTTEKGLLDFIIWRRQADRLGIQLTTDDIARQYKQETLYSSSSAEQILRQELGMQPNPGTMQTLLAALGDEFRVRMAQAALVGYDPGGHIGQVPTAITPYEFWDYYRSNRTELSLKLLPLPVQKFLPQVKEQPTEKELGTLFDKYSNEEYAPSKDTPGFKQLRRLKIEWISASADSPYYRNQARHLLLSLVAATPVNAWSPLMLLDPLASEYENLKWSHFRAPPLTVSDFASAFYDYRYFQRPENAAAVVGQAWGSAGGQGTPLMTLAAYQSAAVGQAAKELAPLVAREAQRRLPLSVAFLAAGTTMPPTLACAAIWQYAAKVDAYLPMDLVKGQLVQKVQQSIADTLLAKSLEAFTKQLEILGREVGTKKLKPADAEQQIRKAVTEHGWAHGAMAELQDQYAINRDAPSLAPLKEAYMRNSQFGDAKGKQFAQRLFFSQAGDAWKNYAAKELSTALSLETGEKKKFLYWKTEDQAAKELSFAQARAQVEQAWRMEKARALARAKAEELAKQARDAHGDFLPVLIEAGKSYGTVFDLSGVARWVRPSLSSRANPFAPYQHYAVPEEKMEYPPLWPNFVDPLLAKLNEPGETLVISNRPKDVYYVVALARRAAPSLQDFYKETTSNRELLLTQLELERQKSYREAVVMQLENEAQLSINPEALERLKERTDLRAE